MIKEFSTRKKKQQRVYIETYYKKNTLYMKMMKFFIYIILCFSTYFIALSMIKTIYFKKMIYLFFIIFFIFFVSYTVYTILYYSEKKNREEFKKWVLTLNHVPFEKLWNPIELILFLVYTKIKISKKSFVLTWVSANILWVFSVFSRIVMINEFLWLSSLFLSSKKHKNYYFFRSKINYTCTLSWRKIVHVYIFDLARFNVLIFSYFLINKKKPQKNLKELLSKMAIVRFTGLSYRIWEDGYEFYKIIEDSFTNLDLSKKKKSSKISIYSFDIRHKISNFLESKYRHHINFFKDYRIIVHKFKFTLNPHTKLRSEVILAKEIIYGKNIEKNTKIATKIAIETHKNTLESDKNFQQSVNLGSIKIKGVEKPHPLVMFDHQENIISKKKLAQHWTHKHFLNKKNTTEWLNEKNIKDEIDQNIEKNKKGFAYSLIVDKNQIVSKVIKPFLKDCNLNSGKDIQNLWPFVHMFHAKNIYEGKIIYQPDMNKLMYDVFDFDNAKNKNLIDNTLIDFFEKSKIMRVKILKYSEALTTKYKESLILENNFLNEQLDNSISESIRKNYINEIEENKNRLKIIDINKELIIEEVKNEILINNNNIDITTFLSEKKSLNKFEGSDDLSSK